jgi:hypothetical protein
MADKTAAASDRRSVSLTAESFALAQKAQAKAAAASGFTPNLSQVVSAALKAYVAGK